MQQMHKIFQQNAKADTRVFHDQSKSPYNSEDHVCDLPPPPPVSNVRRRRGPGLGGGPAARVGPARGQGQP